MKKEDNVEAIELFMEIEEKLGIHLDVMLDSFSKVQVEVEDDLVNALKMVVINEKIIPIPVQLQMNGNLLTSILFKCLSQLYEKVNLKEEIRIENNKVEIHYKNKKILEANLATNEKFRIVHQKYEQNKCVTNMITITNVNYSVSEMMGQIFSGDDSLACESDSNDTSSTRIVRNVVGKSKSLLNNGVYERQDDWLLSIDKLESSVKVQPINEGYSIYAKGWEIVIRFRTQYYKNHRGLSNFEPSQYKIWKDSVVGWCSWFAYYNKITENDVKNTTTVLSEKLRPYGLKYIQMDDGFQKTPIGLPHTWTEPNEKFPSGLTSLAKFITEKNLSPGIWTNVAFANSNEAQSNKHLFVKNEKGELAYGNWVGFIMDGSPECIKHLITPVYKRLKEMGWVYFKLDALRHLKYEGFNSHQQYFKDKKIDRNLVYRNIVAEVRKQIGNDSFLMGCWGIRPELVGLIDGCRIGTDGYSYAGLAQFNSFNNVIWKNDPDHIELTEKEAFKSCSVTSITGSLYMLTDKHEIYENKFLLEAAKRTIPVLFTLPTQVYDVDPSRSSKINGSDIEMSGSGPRLFDASSNTTCSLFSLEINKSYGSWIILNRISEKERLIQFKDLGVPNDKKYLVFEFWTKSLCGVFSESFQPSNFDPLYNTQVFCIRELLEVPQFISSNRHVSCGALEVSNLEFKNNTLHGSSEVVLNEEYVIYVHEKSSFKFSSCELSGDCVLSQNVSKDNLRIISFVSKKDIKIDWSIKYQN